MRIICILMLTALEFAVHGQRKFIVVYDKLGDSISYEESIYKNGREELRKIKKPRVSDGDMLVLRAINVNDFVFDVSMSKPVKNTKAPTNNPIGQILNVFSPFFSQFTGQLGKVITETSQYVSMPPASLSIPRNASLEPSQQELNMMEISQKIQLAHATLESSKTSLISLKDGVNMLLDETMTLENIRQNFGVFKERFPMDSLIGQMETVHNLAAEIELLSQGMDSISPALTKECKRIKDVVQQFDRNMGLTGLNRSDSPTDAESESIAFDADLLSKIETKLEEATFTKEHTFIITDDAFGSEHSNEWESFLKFHYLSNQQKATYSDPSYTEDPYSDDGIQMVRKITLDTDTPNLPVWTTGVNVVRPFQGIQNFSEPFQDGDSMLIRSQTNEAFLFSVGTSLAFEFKTSKEIIPNINAGLSLGLLQADGKVLSFLIGGGFRLRSVPFLSLNAGLSFTENTKLKDGYIADDWMTVPENFDPSQRIGRTTFAPGYFFGLSIHL